MDKKNFETGNFENLEFQAKISVLPELKLPDYQKIASTVERKKISVSEKEIEETLSWLQKSRAKFSQKIGACQKGDFIEIEYSSPQLESGKVYKDAFVLGQGHFFEDFEKNLEGMAQNQEKEILASFPQSHSQKNLAGQKVNFKVKIVSVQKMELPEINDQLAQNLGKFENLNNLKENIKEGIALEKENKEKERIRLEILEKISQKTSLDIPELLINSEKAAILEDFKKRVVSDLQISFEDYLSKIKKSEKELVDSFLQRAQERVKKSIILREISKRENVSVSEKELEDEINNILKRYPDIKETKKLDLEKLRNYTEEVIRNEKTFQALESYSLK